MQIISLRNSWLQRNVITIITIFIILNLDFFLKNISGIHMRMIESSFYNSAVVLLDHEKVLVFYMHQKNRYFKFKFPPFPIYC